MTHPSTRAAPRHSAPRHPVAARKVGYLVGAVVNGLLLWAVSVWPGWDALPFLTADTTKVLGWVNASIVVGLVANLAYAAADPPRFKALGDVVQNVVGLAAMARMWQVFPFHFDEGRVDWNLLARWGLGLAMAGAAIAVVVALVHFVRGTR